MATFRVGQRVRIIGCDKPRNRHLIGNEDVVVGCYPDGSGDIVLASHPLPTGENRIRADYLEPILPQAQHEPCESDFKRDLDRLLEKQGVPA